MSRSRRRRLPVLIAALVALLAAAAPVRADDALDVLSVGWDDTVVPGTWTPVRIHVGGGAADATGRVEVIVKSRPPMANAPFPVPEQIVGAYGQDVALPAGGSKEITVWVPTAPSMTNSADAQPGTVRLVVGGQVLAESDVEFRTGKTPQWPLIGVLADAPAIQRSIAQVSVPYQGLPVPVNVAALDPMSLPASGERLRAFKAIVVQGSAPSTMTAEQRDAVRQWVAGGGHLILVGGPDAARAMAVLPPDTLPAHVSGANNAASLAPLAGWLGGQNDPVGVGPAARLQAAGGVVLVGAAAGAADGGAGAGANPLVWRTALGEGSVTVLAADPSLAPLASWPGRPALFGKLLDPALASFSANMPSYAGYQAEPTTRLQSAVDALPADAYPSLAVVALILGGFALAVGPVAHIVLRRLDRRGWIWLVAPGAATLVVVGLYVVGIGRAGRDVVGNVVADVRITPEEGGAQAAIVAGYYSPTRQNLAVTEPDSGPIRASGSSSSGPYSGASAYYSGSMPVPSGGLVVGKSSGSSAKQDVPFFVMSGRDTRVEYLGGQWAMRTLSMERALGSDVGQVTTSLHLEENRVTGSVRNDTRFFLEDAAILTGSTIVKLGSLAPGQTAPAVIDLGDGASASSPGYQPLSYRLLGSVSSSGSGQGMPAGVVAGGYYPPPGAYGGPSTTNGERWELPKGPETARRARLADAVTQPMGPYSTGLGATQPLTFVAFTRSPLGIPLPTAGVHPLYTLSFVEQRLRLDVEPGAFRLPAALSQPEYVTQAAPIASPFASSGLPRVTSTYRYRPPLPPGATVDALELSPRAAPTGLLSPAPIHPPSSSPFNSQVTLSPASNSTLELYNWQTGDWDTVSDGQEEERVEPAAAYVSTDGEVRLRTNRTPFGGPNGQSGAPELVVEGTVHA